MLNVKKRVYFQGDLAEPKEAQRAVKSEIRKRYTTRGPLVTVSP